MNTIDTICLWIGRVIFFGGFGWIWMSILMVHCRSFRGIWIFLMNMKTDPPKDIPTRKWLTAFPKALWEIYWDEWGAELGGYRIEYRRIKPNPAPEG